MNCKIETVVKAFKCGVYISIAASLADIDSDEFMKIVEYVE